MKAIITTDANHIPFLRRAYQFAHVNSDDPDTHNGALLVSKNGELLLVRANQIPYGVKVLPKRLKRPEKYAYIEHAERNVIYAAAKKGSSTDDATLYVVWPACIECARAIVASGIKRVVGHKAMMDKTPARWKESIETALQMLDEAGVEVLLYDGKIGSVDARIDGKDWQP